MATDNTYRKFHEMQMCVLRHASGQTDKQTYRHAVRDKNWTRQCHTLAVCETCEVKRLKFGTLSDHRKC